MAAATPTLLSLQLLEAASAEFYVLRVPHTFPTKQYK